MRYNDVAAHSSYLTVFSRRSRSEIFRPAVAINIRFTLALHHRGHLSTIATVRDCSYLHHRARMLYDTRVHDRRPPDFMFTGAYTEIGH